MTRVPVEAGRQDRRRGNYPHTFESKVIKPLSEFDLSSALSWRVAQMTEGPAKYAEKAGLGLSRARRLMTWARDAGLLEKIGNSYHLTPLGKLVSENQRRCYLDHIALMTGDQELMKTHRPRLDAVAYWLYANWPENVSTVRRLWIEREWHKITGDKWGRFTDYLPALEAGTKTSVRQGTVTWAHIADLDWVAVSRSLNREDFAKR